MPDGIKGGYPDDWEGKTLVELANEDGTYGKNRSSEDEVELFLYVMRSAFQNVGNEMHKQLAKWGVQNHPSFRITQEHQYTDCRNHADPVNNLPSEEVARRWCEEEHANGTGTWCDILLEELAEACSAAYRNQDPTGYSVPYPEGVGDTLPEDMEEANRVAHLILASGSDDVYYEVLQTAAVACAWLTSILVGRNREVALTEMEQSKREQELKAKWFRDIQQKAQLLMNPPMEADLRTDEDDQFIPGGYI